MKHCNKCPNKAKCPLQRCSDDFKILICDRLKQKMGDNTPEKRAGREAYVGLYCFSNKSKEVINVDPRERPGLFTVFKN